MRAFFLTCSAIATLVTASQLPFGIADAKERHAKSAYTTGAGCNVTPAGTTDIMVGFRPGATVEKQATCANELVITTNLQQKGMSITGPTTGKIVNIINVAKPPSIEYGPMAPDPHDVAAMVKVTAGGRSSYKWIVFDATLHVTVDQRGFHIIDRLDTVSDINITTNLPVYKCNSGTYVPDNTCTKKLPSSGS